MKLFGWESNFTDSVDQMYKNELQIEDDKVLRDSLFTFMEAALNGLMPIAVFGSYTALGNTLTLSKMAITIMMLNIVRSKLEKSRDLYQTYFDSMACMERLWEFYTAPEAQKNIVERLNNNE